MDEHSIKTLAAMARCLYPHDALPDAIYKRVAETIARAAERREFLLAGVAALDAGGSFAALSEAAQTEALKEIEGTRFFEEMRAAAVRHLYSDPEVWRKFGYEGPAHQLGDYIRRGFDDLPWLPEKE